MKYAKKTDKKIGFYERKSLTKRVKNLSFLLPKTYKKIGFYERKNLIKRPEILSFLEQKTDEKNRFLRAEKPNKTHKNPTLFTAKNA